MAQSPEWPDLKWMPPRSFTTGRPDHIACPSTGKDYPGGPRVITVHYTAGAEGYDDAEGGASYDQRRTDGTSAHYYVDADSVVQCVKTSDRSHTALFHGNLLGIHYELCGTAQTRAQWLDVVSRRTIRNAARQMARDMVKHGIPLKRLVTRDLRTPGVKGVCGHYDWTYGWPEDKGTHTDPGNAFPWDVLFDDLEEFLGGEDVNLDDKVQLTAGQMGLFPDDKGIQDGSILVNTALGGGYAFSRKALDEVAGVKAEIAALKSGLASAHEKLDRLATGTGYTLAEIAKAVNDDAHARSAE